MLKQSKLKYKSVSILFLSITVIHLGVSLFLSLISEKYTIPMSLELIMSELIIVVPGIVWMLAGNVSVPGDLGFRKIKVSTVLMTILLAELLNPVITLINLLSQLFTDNAVLSLTESFGSENGLLMIILIGIYGPFCEELVFRGIISRRMMRYASPLVAALVSGAFFGLMHMNFNQFCYAFALGVVFAIVNYATGSIWPSMIMHMVYNTKNAVLMFIITKVMSGGKYNIQEEVSAAYDGDMMYYLIGVYLLIAVVFTLVSLPVFEFIARNEGKPEAYREMLKKPDLEEASDAGKSWWLNGYSIAAVAICVIVIFFLDMIMKMAGIG